MFYGKHKNDYLLYELLRIDLNVNDLTEKEENIILDIKTKWYIIAIINENKI